uniref:Chitin-binding type-2 domain-containing protein n=1 Tax=Parastrongyloides trichosuri TaxID=131310 RepID=A0A0N5A0L0_PARTI
MIINIQFIVLVLITLIAGDQFDIYPYEAILPKVVRTECRSFDGRKLCVELYNYNAQPRNQDMICEPFGHYSQRCFYSQSDYRWVQNIYKPYVENLKIDEDDPLVGNIDYDYKSYASVIRNECTQNCPVLDIEETIPVVHIPYDSPTNIPVENSVIRDKYGNIKRYQKMTFIDGKSYFVEVPKQKVSSNFDIDLCNEKRRDSVLYNNNKEGRIPCEIQTNGKEHTARPVIPIISRHHPLNLFDNDVIEYCDFENGCKITHYHIPFNFNSDSDLYKEMRHKYGHLYENRRIQHSQDISDYSKNWDYNYRNEYNRQRQEYERNERFRHYSRRCYSSGRCKFINIRVSDCDDQFDDRNCDYTRQRNYDNRRIDYRVHPDPDRIPVQPINRQEASDNQEARRRILQWEEYARRAKLESEREIQKIKERVGENADRDGRIRTESIDRHQKYHSKDDRYESSPQGCSYELNVRRC